MRGVYIYIIIAACGFSSCSGKYQPYINKYNFKSPDGKPDYSNLDYWAAHPWKWDPSDSVPAPLRNETRDSIADVFFLHPTTYTRMKNMKGQNAVIDDDYINAKTDYSTILYQASVFNQQSRVFAPRYRQAHITTFYKTEKKEADKAFALAYEDLRSAFLYYLQYWNKGRPIIIASHSQGSLMAEKLLKEFFDVPDVSQQATLKNKLVVAYIVGWPVSQDYFTSLKMCTDSLQTGCLCSWRTFRKGFVPYYLKNNPAAAYATNPLIWTTGNEYASKKLNKGTVLRNFNKVFTHTSDAQVTNGFLYINKPKFPGSFLYLSKNYHVGDINLYYLNIRENVKQRIEAYLKK